MNKCRETAVQRAKNIKLALFDVDGVLTDGKIYFTSNDTEYKAFHSHDGMGMKMLLKANVEIGIITARTSQLVKKRMDELGVKHVFQGQEDKRIAYETIKQNLNLTDAEIAYTGDDINDVGLIKRCGLGIAVANATTFVQQHAHWCTERQGGNGAVREVCEFILTAKDQWQCLCEQYL